MPNCHQISAAQLRRWELALSLDDLKRLSRISAAGRAMQFVAGRALLAAMIERYIGSDVLLSVEPSGKPVLSRGACSVAHSGSGITVALSCSDDLSFGVDIEQPKKRDYMAVAKSYFHIDEFEKLQSMAGSAQQSLFFSLWVQKEALAKCLGKSVLSVLGKDVAVEANKRQLVGYVGRNKQFFFSLVANCDSFPIVQVQTFNEANQCYQATPVEVLPASNYVNLVKFTN